VPPRKNRPVLYEVVSRSQWSRSHGGPRRGAAPPVTPVDQPSASVPGRVPASASSTDQDAPSRGVHVQDGRIHFSLGWLQSLVIAVLLVVVLVATYRAGVHSTLAPADNPDELSQILAEPVSGERPAGAMPTPGRGRDADVSTPPSRGAQANRIAEQPRPGSAVSPAPASPTFTPTPGKYYVLVQYFSRRSQRAAEAGRDFLRSNGVAAAVVEGRGDWRLVATEAFESSAQAQRLVRRIRELGAQYARSGSGYDFAGAEARRF